MTRSVTADHILFKECIEIFRGKPEHQSILPDEDSKSYLMTGFHLPEIWELPYTKISPSVQVKLPGAQSSFVCEVDNPKWVGTLNPHLYGLALASVVSFVTGRPCQSTKNSYLSRRQDVTERDLMELAIINPILVAGAGMTYPHIPQQKLEQYKSTITSLMKKLHEIPLKEYMCAMQAIRLVHLSILNKKVDFGLAYLLIVSAIESISQKAIKDRDVKIKNPSEIEWKARAQTDNEFNSLLQEYKKIRGNNSYLKEKYVKFISKYVPHECWKNIVPHPEQDWVDHQKYTSSTYDPDYLDYTVRQRWHEIYPDVLSTDIVTKILEDSYKHRSCFIHRGEQPPHIDPISSNRFFQEVVKELNDYTFQRVLLPNYTLMLSIAQQSIIKWAMEQ